MKTTFLAIALMLMTAGCATTMTPCQQAQMGFVVSVAALDKIATATPEVKAYWEAYKDGASKALELYCTGAK